jgi:hypothetical protein
MTSFNPKSAVSLQTATRSRADEGCTLVLQGGGALGAYQGGVFDLTSDSPTSTERTP